jgi:hypothetical protein
MRTSLSLSLSLVAAAMAATFFAPPASSQGALKPVDAMIVNPQSRPVPVHVLSAPMAAGEGSYTPYRLRADVSFGGGGGACVLAAQLPAGKRLVLTHLSGFASLPPPAALSYVAAGLVENGQLTGPAVLVPAAPSVPSTDFLGTPRNVSAAGQQVHAYIDGALALCIGSPAPVNGSAQVLVYGYLVDRP